MMIHSDFFIGLFTGLIYGLLFKSVFEVIYKFSIQLINLKVRNVQITVILGSLLASTGVGIFLISVLLLKQYIYVWNTFVAAYSISFFAGALVYRVLLNNRFK